MSIAITKVEIAPQGVECGGEILIAVCAYEVSYGAGERRMPFRLRTLFNQVTEHLPYKLGLKGRI